jgi:gamma-glutamyltranspeptidase / glutathione hydrolase
MVHRLAVLLAIALTGALLPLLGSPSSAVAQAVPGEDLVQRLAGPGRVDTAIAAAQEGWESSDAVLLASAADFPDALVAAALAVGLDAPILLTSPGALLPAVQAEIARLDPDEVVLLGGTAALGLPVEQALRDDGLTVRRVAGATRYGTAATTAVLAGAPAGEVVVASGAAFPDALAAGALAATEARMPTLLTAPNALSSEAEAALAELEATRVHVLGGEGAVSAAVVTRLEELGYDVVRLGGPTRYDTAALVAGEALQRRSGGTLGIVAATGERFPDALAAAALAARTDRLLILVPADDIVGAFRVARLVALSGDRLTDGLLLGGTAAVSEAVADALAVLLAETDAARVATAVGSGGAAATVVPLATEAALSTLEEGGNAIDATIAAAGVLGVVQPYSAGIGGGGFMVIRTAAGELATIDSREEAPSGYTADVWVGEDGTAIPFTERVVSGLGVGVPGTVAGWELALERFGSLPLGGLLQPGIELARYGFPIDETFASQTATEANLAKFGTFTSTAELYLRDGTPPVAGDWLRNPDLADTYARIAAEGPTAFYSGDVAAAIVDAVRNPPVVEGSERVVRPSPMVVEDLADYEAVERDPIVSTFRDVEVVGMGLPSSAGLTNALALNMLETFDPGAPREEVLHRYLESLRLAWADRNAFMGDSDVIDVPEIGLQSEAYAALRAELIGPEAATEQRTAGDPTAFEDDAGGMAAAGQVDAVTDGSTTHLTVADEVGNVVAYTFTIEQIGGSGIVVPGYGFLLNNELTDFDPVPPHPNEPGPNKRPRSSMAPTIVLQDGEPLFAVGTPGGATIISTVLQIVVDVVENGAPLPAALAAPRVANFNPADLAGNAEAAFLDTPEAAALRQRGHTFNEAAEIGAATGIAFGPDGQQTAVAEPTRRGAGSAGVVRPAAPDGP